MKCELCKARALDWLVQYWEGFCGPRAEWGEETTERLMRDYGLLIAFTDDFHSPDQSPEQSK